MFIVHLAFVFSFPENPPAQGLRQYEEDKYSTKQGEATHDNERQGQPNAARKGGLFLLCEKPGKNLCTPAKGGSFSLLISEINASEMLVAPRISECFGLL